MTLCMESGGHAALDVSKVKKAAITPKAIIHQRFGEKACYKVEEVHEAAQNGCPGLSIPQKGPCLYRCRLELPDLLVVSETFKKKKDAEQAAAQKALLQLGINSTTNSPTTLEEAWEELIARLAYFFSNEFLAHQHPVSGHLRAVMRREGDLCGLLPLSVIAAFDAKVGTLCKFIDPKVDSNPCSAVSIIMTAADKSSESFTTSEGQLFVRRRNAYPTDILESSKQSCSSVNICLYALYIPSSMGELVKLVRLEVPPTGYYLDIIAEKLGLENASEVLISRPIGKSASEMRLYFAAPELYLLRPTLSSSNSSAKNIGVQEGSINTRASYLSSQDIYGDAILASIGYTRRSKDLFFEDVSIQSYYRMLISKKPSGIYKLSRDAVITAQLPRVYSTRTNWRGTLPREILCTFCRQHRLSEPVFTTSSFPRKGSSELSSPSKKLRIMESTEEIGSIDMGSTATVEEVPEKGSTFTCEVKVLSKLQDLIIVCSSKDICKSQSDCIHTASLKVLSWLNAFFEYQNMPPELSHMTAGSLQSKAKELDITFYAEHMSNAFKLCPSVPVDNKGMHINCMDRSSVTRGHRDFPVDIKGLDSGVCPSSGSLVHVSYSVSLVAEGGHVKELLESSDEFEYEMGVGSVIGSVEAVVAQMSIGQSAFFSVDLPDQELLLAASSDYEKAVVLLKSNACRLEYCITLLQIIQPLEDRIEQALFSPPLSKQRVEYAVHHIKESNAASLVDFGCGSGSLLDSLLDYTTSLEKIVGVDISHKSLARAAKVLHSKLTMDSSSKTACPIKSAILYDGSITDFDSRLCGFDIGTCLEVIEHMEEDQAHLFGDVVLSLFRPRTLIVSTPNYEYNVLLQGSSSEEDADAQGQVVCKFRNHDHKFEWTRKQFELWASRLATKHNYQIEFGGVGGSGDTEHGYASQIAVFRREDSPGDKQDADCDANRPPTHLYNVIWELNKCNISAQDPTPQ